VNFDTDHVPEPTYLTETLGYFQDPRVAFVQTAQAYYNQDVSFIARGAAEETYAYYSSHLMASYALGHPVVVGSHCAHRLAALKEIGGFPAHDAEDLFQTMLYRASGWRGVNVPRILALGTTPVDWPGYLKQQLRWSRSVIDLKLHALPSVSKQLPRRERMLNLFHGVHYLRPLLYPALILLLCYLLVTNTTPAFLELPAILAVLGLAGTISIVDRFRQRYFLDPERESGVHWRALVLQFAKWPIFGLAVLDLITGNRRPYQTTSKDGRVARLWVLAPGQILTGAAIAVAWAAGEYRNGPIAHTLEVLAVLVIAFCVVLAWTETFPRKSAFAPELRQQAVRRHAA
jgi:cellulose synthase (UDP-forming)